MSELKGDLALMPLGDVVIWLANRGQSGRLEVQRDEIRKRFDVVEGQVIRAASNDPREYFGQFLVHLGLLTEDQLTRAFQTQNETKVLLGRILVMIGIVPEEQVIHTLRIKVSESLLDVFRWTRGRFHFVDDAMPEERPQIDVQVPLEAIHREGVGRTQMWSRYNQLFPDPRYLLQVDPSRVPDTATPDTLEGRIVELARSGLSIEAITLDLHATDYQIATRILKLYQQGALHPRSPTDTLLPLDAPPGAHADRARSAMDQNRYSEALRYVDEGSRSQSSPELEAIKSALGAHGEALNRRAVPQLLGEPPPQVLRRLSAKQRYVLARIDGSRTVESIIQVSPMHDDEALEILRQFMADRIIQCPEAQG